MAALMVSVSLSAAQNSPSATPEATASPAVKNSDGTPGAGNSGLDYIFNRKPQDGTFAGDAMDANRRAKAKIIAQDAIGGGRIEDFAMRLRFEKYLTLPEVAESELNAYEKDFANVQQLLRNKKIYDAWGQLFKLAEYEAVDGGVSWELANRIDSIWNAGQTNVALDRNNAQLRRDIATANRTADLMSDDIRDKEALYQRRFNDRNKTGKPANNGGAPMVSSGDGAATVDSVMGKLQLTEEYLKSLELKAKIKLNELKAEKLFDQARNDFAEYITALFESGRQRHVLLAAEFWRKIFNQGEYPVAMARQVNASLEISREVKNSMDGFNYCLEKNHLAAATDRLQEAFMLNELHPAVLSLSREKKARVEAFTSRLSRMQNMIEARDFARLEALLAELRELAPDFDTTKPLAMVSAVKLESQLRLGKAKLAAQQGNLQQALEDFQAAAQTWPGNPDLQDKALSFFNSQDAQTQSLAEFDRLAAENNYRAIFDRQLYFAPAMKDDARRQEQLKEALEKVRKAETAAEKAHLLRANGDVFGAWETVELAARDLPADLKLNALRGELSGRGAEFVAAINKAREAEVRKELGYSLTWYAIAQRCYPASQIANQAMERLSEALVADQPPVAADAAKPME